MILSSNTLSSTALSGTLGGTAGFVPTPPAVDQSSFHAALAGWLYPNTIERERIALFGQGASATLYSVTPGAGESEMAVLTTGWVARRIPTIESGADEGWRLEITDPDITWAAVMQVATVKIIGADGMPQMYRVLQVENAMKPGHVYLLRLESIGQ